MKSARLVVLALALLGTAASAEPDAYRSLEAVAASAAADKGPDAGGLDGARAERALDEKAIRRYRATANGVPPARRDDLRDSVSDVRPAAPAASPETASRTDAPVAVPAAASRRGRLWTRLFAALMPAARPGFDAPAVSTSAWRRRLTPEEAAGQARGMQELISVGSPSPLPVR